VLVHVGTARTPEGAADPRRFGSIPADGDGVGWTVLAPGASVGGHVSSWIARGGEQAATRSGPAVSPLAS
jgi:hypothetical protein